MFGRLIEIHKQQLTMYCFLIVASAAPLIVQIEGAQTISQSTLKQNEIVRNSKSQEMLKYMNLGIDPCQDFYAYACGNWPKYHMRTKEKEIVTTFSELAQKVNEDLIELLEEPLILSDGVNGRKAKEFYQSCKQAVANGQKQQSFHSAIVKNNGGFPAAPGSNWALYNSNYDWPLIVGQLRHKYSLDILIGVDIVVNPFAKNEYTIFLTEPSTILPEDLCSVEGTKQIDHYREEYERVERVVVANIKNWLSLEQTAALKVANDILMFEYELCTAMRAGESSTINKTNQSMSHKRLNLYELTRYFNDSIDFYKFISTSYTINYAKPVAIRSEHYFRHLIHTINIHNRSTLANYIMYRALSTLSFPLQDNKKNRPKFCSQLTKRYFPQVVGYMYYYKFANIPARAEVEGIFDKLKNVFKRSLDNSWLTDIASRSGRYKLQNIKLHFPTYEEKPNLNDLSIDVNNFWKNLNEVMPQLQQQEQERVLASDNRNPDKEVEAYELRMKYHKDFDRIDIGWALLQPPFFRDLYSRSMNYAMIGQLLAKQLASAFDDKGWSSNVIVNDNWDYQTALGYKNRTECIRRQLSYYLNNNADTFQNITQLREIATTSSSANIAFAAYLNWLDFLNPNNDYEILRKETLSDLNFTNTQLFFITFAQMNCVNERDNKTFAAYCPLQRHSLARYRVNGPLWNGFEFSKEFKCRIGSQMNIVDKCIIY